MPLPADPAPVPTNDGEARARGAADAWEAAKAALAVEEVQNGAMLGGPLFRATFGAPPPAVPRHFVALYRTREEQLRVGAYIHYMAFRDSAWLCGGLCVDRRFYLEAPDSLGACVKRMGGLGEIVLRDTFERLTDRSAIFGYCGDARQWQHDLNIGFEPAGPPLLLVRWTKALADSERDALIERVRAIGPF
jgi:hypothetical protein